MADEPAENAAPKAAKRKRKRAGGRPFAPGQSGKKPGTRHRTTMIAQALVDGQAEVIINTIIQIALEGDHQMLRWLGDRLLPARMDRHVEIPVGSVRTIAVTPAPSGIAPWCCVANRLVAPSGHALAQWLESDFICDRRGRRFIAAWREDAQRKASRLPRVRVEMRQLQQWCGTFDRSLASKEEIELGLFVQLRDLFSLQVDLVFYALSDQVKRFLAFFPIYPHSVHSCLRSVAVVGVVT
jgi:hypothetical protein